MVQGFSKLSIQFQGPYKRELVVIDLCYVIYPVSVFFSQLKMVVMKIHFSNLWENSPPVTEFPRIFCAGIGPLQLGVVVIM